MADFKAHTSLGALWGVVWGIIALLTGLCSFMGSIVVLFLATVGSAIPDIDSPTGRPRELVLSFLGVMLPVVVFLNFYPFGRYIADYGIASLLEYCVRKLPICCFGMQI